MKKSFWTSRIAWIIVAKLVKFIAEKQAVLTPEEKKEWNRQWTQDFTVGK